MSALIMLVDDSPTERAYCCKILRPRGYKVVEFENANDALDNIKELKPDLVIMDVVMPKLNGFQACRKLKRDDETKGIPVVLLTSKGEETDKVWGMRQGADSYLVKPADEEELLNVVKQYIGAAS
jgi:twitching motility two-component system response regulator PilH